MNFKFDSSCAFSFFYFLVNSVTFMSQKVTRCNLAKAISRNHCDLFDIRIRVSRIVKKREAIKYIGNSFEEAKVKEANLYDT